MAEFNKFTCPRGHDFSANAKLRARCPNCGLMAKRDFNSQAESKSTVTPTKDTGVKKASKSLLPLSRRVVSKSNSETGSKPASILKKAKPSPEKPNEGTKDLVESQKSTKRLKVVSRRRPKVAMPKKKVVKQAPSATRRLKVKKGNLPKVIKKPTGSREKKVVEQIGKPKRFWEQAQEKYFSR